MGVSVRVWLTGDGARILVHQSGRARPEQCDLVRVRVKVRVGVRVRVALRVRVRVSPSSATSSTPPTLPPPPPWRRVSTPHVQSAESDACCPRRSAVWSPNLHP